MNVKKKWENLHIFIATHPKGFSTIEIERSKRFTSLSRLCHDKVLSLVKFDSTNSETPLEFISLNCIVHIDQ